MEHTLRSILVHFFGSLDSDHLSVDSFMISLIRFYKTALFFLSGL
jgi:hypothetical protein